MLCRIRLQFMGDKACENRPPPAASGMMKSQTVREGQLCAAAVVSNARHKTMPRMASTLLTKERDAESLR